jgi:hypothetical protein
MTEPGTTVSLNDGLFTERLTVAAFRYSCSSLENRRRHDEYR